MKQLIICVGITLAVFWLLDGFIEWRKERAERKRDEDNEGHT